MKVPVGAGGNNAPRRAARLRGIYDARQIPPDPLFMVIDMPQKVFPFLMFSGQTEEAMHFYVSLFAQAEILSLTRYGANEAGREGTVVHATFSLKGQVLMCIDSSVPQPFTFTPAMSLYVVCETAQEIARVFARLSQNGAVLMPLAAYPFSKLYGWVQDRFGVSRQLSLEDSEIA